MTPGDPADTRSRILGIYVVNPSHLLPLLLLYISVVKDLLGRAQAAESTTIRSIAKNPCRRIAMDSTNDVPVHGNLDRGSELFLVQTIFVAIAGVCLLGRGYIKCFIIKVNLLDDYLLYGAMV